MSPTPAWVKELTPSSPQGSELLAREREGSKISVDKLSNFLFTKQVLNKKAKLLKILESEKAFDKSQNYFDGRVDRFQTALARAKRLQQLTVKHNWSDDDFQMASEV